MNRPEFDEFAALWQDEPDLMEQAQIEAYARAARRRGRLLAYADYAIAVLLVGGFAIGIFISKNPLTLIPAVLLMIAIIWMTWKRRQMRQMALTLSTSDRESFIESSIRNVHANLRRQYISIGSLPFIVPLALFFKVSLRTGGGPQEVLEAFVAWTQTIRAPITVILLMGVAALSLRSIRKLKRELRQLERLRSGYREEADKEKGQGRPPLFPHRVP
jgi:hypothetical protein